jgi:hypothetical protein
VGSLLGTSEGKCEVFDDLPPFMTVEQSAKVLQIGRSKAYELTVEWERTAGRSGLPFVRCGWQKADRNDCPRSSFWPTVIVSPHRPLALRGARDVLAPTNRVCGGLTRAQAVVHRLGRDPVADPDQASLDAFAASDPHQHITEGLAPLMHPSSFAFFAIAGVDVPLSWDQVSNRLDPATPSSRSVTEHEGT